MSNSPSCRQCGAPVPEGRLAGLCPACLLQQGMAESRSQPEATPFVPLSPADLAPYFPQLEILELVGRGGMGAVYKAYQKSLDRLVAVKILPPGIGADPAFAERFAREAKALAKLNHPNIVTLHEFGQADGLFYFIMEFVDGLNLRQLLHASRMSPREALAIVPQICDALQYAHDHGIIHRDIKPENILLDRRGRVKVADFGLAKLVQAGVETANGATAAPAAPAAAELTVAGKVVGTPRYMAPEQTENPSEVDHRADIYSLGVVFYQMLTGELPQGGFSPPSQKVSIDVRLDEVVLRALEQKPELRYPQISLLKTQVEAISQAPVPPPAQDPFGVGNPWFLREPVVFFSLVYAGLLAILFGSARSLPERMASHFGVDGLANGWMSRPAYLLLVGGLPLALAGFFWAIPRLVRRYPRLVNIPRRDYWLAPERQDRTLRRLRRWLLWLGCLLVVFFGSLHFLTQEANQTSPAVLSNGGFMTVLIGFFLGIILWTTAFLMHFAEEEKAWRFSGKRFLASSLAGVAAILLGLMFFSRPTIFLSPQSLAQSPVKLRSLSTDEVVRITLAEPREPWGWRELERRVRGGKMDLQQATRLAEALKVLPQNIDMDADYNVLSNLKPLIDSLNERKLLSEDVKAECAMAFFGKPLIYFNGRIFESEKMSMPFYCKWNDVYFENLFGVEIFNYVKSIKIDGKDVAISRMDDDGLAKAYINDFTNLKPGRHRLKAEIERALAPDKGINKEAGSIPPNFWPSTKWKWIDVVEAEFVVYGKNEEVVKMTKDPTLDPLKCSGMDVSKIIVRKKQNDVFSVKNNPIGLKLVFTKKSPCKVQIVFDVIVKIDGKSYNMGCFYEDEVSKPRTINSGRYMNDGYFIDFLSPQAREAEVILVPNPKEEHVVKDCPAITRIWGQQIVFKHVPLVRYDLPGAKPETTEPQP